MTQQIEILGVCGSPVKDGNVQALLEKALQSQQEEPGVSCDMITLAELDVGDCIHCNFCLRKQKGDKRCSVEDDMASVYPCLEKADILILATPVYFGRLSGHLASFIDRMRIYVHGNVTMGRMRNKVGGSIAVAWFRFAGTEMTLLTMNQLYYALNMVIASPDLGLQGGSAFSSLVGTGRREGDDKRLVLRDEMGVASAISTISRAIELARIMKAGESLLSTGSSD
jgi:multimeric flavodoxin WrbA